MAPDNETREPLESDESGRSGSSDSSRKSGRTRKPKKPRKRRTAKDMAESAREISISEFFAKNRHLLGFDNPLKALLTTVKEGVDNSLDACEEAGILPEVTVEIVRVADLLAAGLDQSRMIDGFHGELAAQRAAEAPRATVAADAPGAQPAAVESRQAVSIFQGTLFDGQEEQTEEEEAAEVAEQTAKKPRRKPKSRGRGVAAPPEAYLVCIEDNGPGILESQVGKIFGKLLYGSKFHRLRQSRGQQGIGISAAGMYGQQTTAQPVRIVSRTDPDEPAHYMEVALDLQRNQPDIRTAETHSWHRERGTRVIIEMTAKYQGGTRSVDMYLRATALANPHVTIRYRDPLGQWTVHERATETMPDEPREVKPHPYGVELGNLLNMVKTTEHKKLGSFLMGDFSRVSRRAAEEVCEKIGLNLTTWMARVTREEEVGALHQALSEVKLQNPPTDCICPIGEDLLIESLAREYPEAFLKAVTRAPSVYRGNPFQVEVALAWGKGIPAEGPAHVLRFANRVPLLYQQGACVVSKAVNEVGWRSYRVDQPRGGSPSGPLVLVVHVASVWVPFTSESKEAIASYPEIHQEIKLAVQECGRALKRHISKTRRAAEERRKRDLIAKFIPKISEALQDILEFDESELEQTNEALTHVLDRSRNL